MTAGRAHRFLPPYRLTTGLRRGCRRTAPHLSRRIAHGTQLAG